jgi:hypothetical protein
VYKNIIFGMHDGDDLRAMAAFSVALTQIKCVTIWAQYLTKFEATIAPTTASRV